MFSWARKYTSNPSNQSGVHFSDGLRQQIRLELPEDSPNTSQPLLTTNQLRAQIKELEEKRSVDQNVQQQLSAQVSSLTTRSSVLDGRLKQSETRVQDFEEKLQIAESNALDLREQVRTLLTTKESLEIRLLEQENAIKGLQELNVDLTNKLQISAIEKLDKDTCYSLKLEQLDKIRTRLESCCKQDFAEISALKKTIIHCASQSGKEQVDTRETVVINPDSATNHTTQLYLGKRTREPENMGENKKPKHSPTDTY